MMEDTANLNRLWAGLIVEELLRNGVEHFVLSPGSRCTPLTAAVAEEPRAKSTVHFDERGAAYFALGQARATERPVALICTSGTAAANYLPAVVEASQSQIPLILLTADRPPELLDTGANQAIDQTRLYGVYACWYCGLPCPDRLIAPGYVLTTVDQAVYRATLAPAGPVHVNCAYREPLAPYAADLNDSEYLAPLSAWKTSGEPYTRYACPASELDSAVSCQLADVIQNAKRGVLLAGQLRNRGEAEAVARLGTALGWPIVADVTSGLRLAGNGDAILHCADLLLCSASFREVFQPDAVIHVGGAITSKRVNQHLQECSPRSSYVRVADHPFRVDPGHRVTLRVEAGTRELCSGLAKECGPRANKEWSEGLFRINGLAGDTIRAALHSVQGLSEPTVASAVSSHLSEDERLFLGNSMPIRDMDMFGMYPASAHFAYANRGASGIDGNVATAAGIASGCGSPVVAVVGDLAVLHDLSSLALLRNQAIHVTLVVINNDGGGIFHFLPVAQQTAIFERYFGTPHGLGFEHAARQFGLGYDCPEDLASLVSSLSVARQRAGSTIIEVRTNRKDNLRIHRELQQAVASAVDGAALP
ncbi:MAG: 2-succinyl-5-enolpyruvyl-6-hydroxy-3-cyclohexene-1-carboxylic-acid synthase [Candidatus Hydrogenedentes bacterium]|nr:2-succinyl-5-enolpyruvyl-6-hydroxy-3-cyclohexene-1-carboxylic-acid synthase [Candidatus Hydrogenedentota bacterium]